MISLCPIAKCFGVRQRQSDVLTKKQRVVGFDRVCMQQARKLGHIIVRKELCGVLGQESRGGKNIESFVAIELQDIADAVKHFAADAAVTRFQPAERAVTSISAELGDLLLGQTALVPEARQQAS